MNEHLRLAMEMAEDTIKYLYKHCEDHLNDEEMDTVLDAVKVIKLCENKNNVL